MNIIYIVLEKKLAVDLSFLVYESALAYRKQLKKDTDINEIIEFFRQREINYFKDKGVDYDIVSAVTAGKGLKVTEDYEKALVLGASRKKEKGFNDIIFALSRVNNILPKDYRVSADVDIGLFDSPEEKALYDRHVSAKSAAAEMMKSGKFAECFALIASFKPEIDAYFNKVLVIADDKAKKENRLNMLAGIKETFYEFADFSRIVVDRKT